MIVDKIVEVVSCSCMVDGSGCLSAVVLVNRYVFWLASTIAIAIWVAG